MKFAQQSPEIKQAAPRSQQQTAPSIASDL